MPSTLTGAKVFYLSSETGKLVSPVQGHTWNDGWNRFHPSEPFNEVNKTRNQTGFHAHHSIRLDYFGNRNDKDLFVYALVEAKGHIVSGDEAFRSEYMKIKAVSLPSLKTFESTSFTWTCPRKLLVKFATSCLLCLVILPILSYFLPAPFIIAGDAFGIFGLVYSMLTTKHIDLDKNACKAIKAVHSQHLSSLKEHYPNVEIVENLDELAKLGNLKVDVRSDIASVIEKDMLLKSAYRAQGQSILTSLDFFSAAL